MCVKNRVQIHHQTHFRTDKTRKSYLPYLCTLVVILENIIVFAQQYLERKE